MTKPSERLIHNVLFTTVSVFMFIFKFIVFIVVYIKSFLSLLINYTQIYNKVLKSQYNFKKMVKFIIFILHLRRTLCQDRDYNQLRLDPT